MEISRAHRWSIGWMVVGILAALMLSGAAYFIHFGWRQGQKLAGWETAEPVRVAVDLSKAGEWRAAFHQTCSIAHGELIELRVSPAFESEDAVTKALAGIKGKLRVVAANGGIEQELELVPDCFGVRKEVGGQVPSLSLMRLQCGVYEMVVTVEEGAAGMAGRQQELVGRYQLCGLESLPGIIAYFLGGVLGVIGVPLGLFAGVRVRRHPR